MLARRLARVGKTLDRSTIAMETSISMPAPSRNPSVKWMPLTVPVRYCCSALASIRDMRSQYK